jgi:hypothetical protein
LLLGRAGLRPASSREAAYRSDLCEVEGAKRLI